MSTKIIITIILPEKVEEQEIREILRVALFGAVSRSKKKLTKLLLDQIKSDATIQVEPCKDEEEDE